MMLNMTRLWFSSPQLELLNELRRGEKPIPEYQKAYQYAKVPTWMKRSMANVRAMIDLGADVDSASVGSLNQMHYPLQYNGVLHYSPLI